MRDEAIDPGAPVTELARLALERAEGNLEEAARMLERWASERAELRDALTRPFLAQACYQAAVAASWYERRVRWRPPGSADRPDMAAAHEAALTDEAALSGAPPLPAS